MNKLYNLTANYNIFWILYFLLISFTQLRVVFRSVAKFSMFPAFSIWDIALAALYITALFTYVFKKKLFTHNTWKIIFLIILIDLPLGVWRTFYGDDPSGLQSNCQTVQSFCNILIPFTLLITAAQIVPVYYALAKLAFPNFKFPFFTYPTLKIDHNVSPNRFWAIPLLGFLIKCFILIPFSIFQIIINIIAFLFQIINYFHIVILGRIWRPAFTFTMWSLSLYVNSTAYLFGLTDNYPSFGKKIKDPLISLDFEPEKKSNRILGIPLIGPILRYLIILPFYAFTSLILNGAFIGVAIGWIVVLFTGKYPKSIYELVSDSMRLQAAGMLYLTAMSDKYPSFSVSLNHPYKKALLIALPVLLSLTSVLFGNNLPAQSTTNYESTFKQSYIRECNSSKKLSKYCECTYTNLRKQYSLNEISSMGIKYSQTNQVPDAMMSAANACVEFIPKEPATDDSNPEGAI